MPRSRFDVTTFGELLLRLSVPSGERLENTKNLAVHPAGAEANVATLLARLGRKSSWHGALPDNPLGRLSANALRAAGVDITSIVWGKAGRLGTYYVEFGEAPRGIQVTYDRAHSCITELSPADVDWASMLDTRLLHLTGITPALSASCREIIVQAIEQARAQHIPVSLDINYRQKLWSEGEAKETLLPLIQGLEILFCSQADAKRLFGCSGSMQEVAEGLLDLSRARSVVVTFGEQGALLWNGTEWRHEPARPTRIVDRLGAGDALAAGVIHGWLDGNLNGGLHYGVTLAALALTQTGDMVISNQAELLRLSQGSSDLSR